MMCNKRGVFGNCVLTHASLSTFIFSTVWFWGTRTSGIPPGVTLTALKITGEGGKKKQEAVIYARLACDGVEQVFSASHNHWFWEIKAVKHVFVQDTV